LKKKKLLKNLPFFGLICENLTKTLLADFSGHSHL
jgi:hypothetical protein